MAEIYFQGRTKEKRDTDANFTSSNIVLLDGEVVIVDMPDGEVRRKIGDGVTPYAQLPFDDEVVREKIDGLAEKIGDLDQLDTTAKADLVAAINEVAASSGGSGEFPEVTNPDNATTTGIYIFVMGVQRGLLLVSASMTVTKQQIMIFSSGTFQKRVFSGSESAGYTWGEWEDIVTNSTVGDLDDLTTTAKNNLVSAINEIAGGSGGQITVQELGQIGDISALDDIKEYGIYSYDLLSEKCWLIVSYDAMAQSGVGYTSQYDFSAGNGIRWRNYGDGDWSTWETLANKSTIGNMNDLSTNEKSSLVAAINEIAAGSGGSSDLPIVVSDTLPEDDYIPDRGEIRITQNTSTSSQASQIDIYSSDRKYGAPITHGGLVQLRVSSSFNNGDMYPYCGDIGFRYRNNNIDGNGQWSEWYRFKDIIAKLDSLESRVAALES